MGKKELSDLSETYLDPLSLVDYRARVGRGCKIWAWSQVREGAEIGDHTSIGTAAYIGPDVVVGKQGKIQNNALIYEPAVLGDGVFIGPGAVLTNDRRPRALNADGSVKSQADWTPVGVSVGEGASIGARAVLVGPIVVGRWAMVGAGAVVTADVKPFSLVLGVPAVHVGWVSRTGKELVKSGGFLRCPDGSDVFREVDGVLQEVTSSS